MINTYWCVLNETKFCICREQEFRQYRKNEEGSLLNFASKRMGKFQKFCKNSNGCGLAIGAGFNFFVTF